MNPVFYIYTKYFIVPIYYIIFSKYRNSLAFQIKIIELLHRSLFLSG